MIWAWRHRISLLEPRPTKANSESDAVPVVERLDALVRGREGWRAAQKLGRTLICKTSRTPRVMATDRPGSDGAARTGMGFTFVQRQHKAATTGRRNRICRSCGARRISNQVPRDAALG